MDTCRIGLAYLVTSLSALVAVCTSAATAAQQASSSSSAAIAQAAPCPGAPLGSFADSSTDTAYLERRGIQDALRKDFNSALAYLHRACELAPSNPEYVYVLGRVQWQSGHLDLAMQSFDRAIALKPDYVQALLARAKLGFKDHARAKADLDAVDRIVSSKDDMRLDLGLTYDAIGESAAAIRQYDLWLDAHVEDNRRAVGLAARCRAQAEADQSLDRALKDCNDALRQVDDNPNATPSGSFIRPHLRDNPDILANRGLVWLRRGELDRAIKDYDDAIAERPKIAEYRFARGVAELRAGRQAKGQADIAAASAMEKDVAERFASWGLKP
jgi:tetratricopeptide (TPR) repeat protein